jgi:membrane protein YqaA with SNARE-associated domain
MNTKRKDEIVIGLAVLLGAILFLNFSVGYEPFLFQFEMPPDINLEIPDNDFTKFALAVTFAYDMLPTVAQQFSISAVTVQLLLTGFSPLLLAIISAVGLLTGQMILYVVGMFVRKIHKGSFGDIAGHHHFLHKYHFLIYFMIPFVGILGDGAMLYSGHQRISPLKIIPFLFIADLASTARWIIPTVAELELGDSLQ